MNNFKQLAMGTARLLSRPTLWLAVNLVFLLWQPAIAEDREFDRFFVKFKQSIQNNDKNGVAAMTKLPFLLNGKQLSKAQFLSQYDKVLPAKVRRCLLKDHPKRDKNSYFVFCGEQIYVFSKVNDHYLFTDIDAND